MTRWLLAALAWFQRKPDQPPSPSPPPPPTLGKKHEVALDESVGVKKK